MDVRYATQRTEEDIAAQNQCDGIRPLHCCGATAALEQFAPLPPNSAKPATGLGLTLLAQGLL
ncbi:hypothetical protein C9I57_31330 [Trinickia symbiotica]|uniref:Uncharacterized protein n=1 Tax=Trinickia symbiotica TaxID=863227 RepID=A0A2T3XK12_9BURK|nr:hypothetical protein C9I57_31330 [Trinickia symbiotica]